MKILGGKEEACPYCKGTMIYLDLKKIGVVSQCKKCGCMVEGRAKAKDYIKIYNYEVDNGK